MHLSVSRKPISLSLQQCLRISAIQVNFFGNSIFFKKNMYVSSYRATCILESKNSSAYKRKINSIIMPYGCVLLQWFAKFQPITREELKAQD
jgi:hypothetical protein